MSYYCGEMWPSDTMHWWSYWWLQYQNNLEILVDDKGWWGASGARGYWVRKWWLGMWCRPSHIESLELTISQGCLVGPLVNTWEEFRREHNIYIINVMAVIKSKYRFITSLTTFQDPDSCLSSLTRPDREDHTWSLIPSRYSWLRLK